MAKMDMAHIKRWLTPEGYQGLDTFLEQLPARVSKTILIAGGVAWAVAAGALLYANLQSTSTAKLHDDLRKTDALRPLVPQIVETPVPVAEMNLKLETAKKTFKNLTIATSDGSVVVSSEDSKYYGAFLQTIYLVMGMGEGYKVTMKEMCQGSECRAKSNKPFLYSSFDVKKLEVKSTESPSGG